MTWAITYNGFGTAGAANSIWQSLDIQNYASDPVFADDGRRVETIHHRITGLATVVATNDANFHLVWDNARAKLNTSEQRLLIKLGSQTLVDIDPQNAESSLGGASTSDKGGYPRVSITQTRIHGARSFTIGFDIEWMERVDDTDTGDVLSHRWNASFEPAENGTQRWTVNGILRTRVLPGTGGGNASFEDPNASVGTDVLIPVPVNPDHFRCAVLPALPINFRIVDGTRWFVHEDGTSLIYTIVAQEYARPMPKWSTTSARDGSGSFAWRRSIDGGGINAIGVKVFDAELEGDATANRGHLLSILLRASMSRIKYGGASGDLIRAIEVTERDIFKRNIVGLRVEALAVGAVRNALSFGTLPNTNLADSLINTFNGLELSEGVSPYGAALIQSVFHRVLDPQDTTHALNLSNGSGGTRPDGLVAGINLPATNDYPSGACAFTYTASDVAAEIEESVFQTFGQAGIYDGIDDNGFTPHEENPYTRVMVREQVYSVPNTLVLASQSLNGKDRPYQMSRPTVLMHSTLIVERLNKPPDRIFLRAPRHSVLRAEGWLGLEDTVDANGNTVVRAVFQRTVQIMNTNAPNGHEIESAVDIEGDSITFRRWVPPDPSSTGHPTMRVPFNPRLEVRANANDQTLFHQHHLEAAVGDGSLTFDLNVGNIGGPEPTVEIQ